MNGTNERRSASHCSAPCSFGARKKIPHSPYTTDGTAASSSTSSVSGARRRSGHSSVAYTAAATATGTPISNASAEVISVPTTSGSAPKCSALTFQSLPNTKPGTPSLANAGRASPTRRMKK